jgi:type III secretion system YscD/HrpQ family protein
MAGYLIAEEGPIAGTVVSFEEGEEWALGRDPDEVTIVLNDPMVSRKHVICRLTSEGYVLENLSSVNPATQNGKVITESVLLREGDILQIGSTFFRFTEREPIPPGSEEEIVPEEPVSHFLEETDELSSVNIEHSGEGKWLLKVISGPNAGAEFGMTPTSTYILGKDPHVCDIVFQDLSVSRQHARLVVDENNHIYIEDMGSRNGVLLNGHLLTDRKELSTQDLISLGTTAFLMIDRDQAQETIVSPHSMPAGYEEEVSEEEAAEEAPLSEALALKKDWREMIIPTRHLIGAGIFAVLLIVAIASMMALFKTQTITVPFKNESAEVQETLKSFEDIQFSFNPANGKLFLVGHVLTGVDKQELLYKVTNLPFVQSVDDNVVIDEYVWQNMNALLMTNPDWQGVSFHAHAPGRFVMKGYLQTSEEGQSLVDYVNMNFPYLDRLENQVVIENNLSIQIQSVLVEKGFSGVTYQLNNGDLVLAGRVDQTQVASYTGTVEMFKALPGIRIVKNYVVYTTADTSRIDISQQYKVSGYSKKDNVDMFVVINGKIFSVGDNMDGMMITNILPNMVLLEKDGLKFRIGYNLQ